MTLPFNSFRTLPKLTDLLELLKRDIFLTLNCHAVATVVSFDATNQTIKATINYSRTLVDSSGTQTPLLYPILDGVPVISLCGGATSLTLPIAQGDNVLILFNDRDLDNWLSGQDGSQVNSPRLHSFSDAIALVGLNDLSSYDAVRALLTNGTVKLGINPQTNKVTINNGTSLNTILQQLITGILGMTAGGNPMVDATGDVNSAKTALGNLLE